MPVGTDRFDLTPQRGERASSQLTQHVDIAELASDPVRPEFAEDEALVAFECGESTGDALDRCTETAGDLGGDERTVRARVSTNQFLEWTRHRLGERHREPEWDRTPEAIPISGCVFSRGVTSFAADRDFDRTLLAEQPMQPLPRHRC